MKKTVEPTTVQICEATWELKPGRQNSCGQLPVIHWGSDHPDTAFLCTVEGLQVQLDTEWTHWKDCATLKTYVPFMCEKVQVSVPFQLSVLALQR